MATVSAKRNTGFVPVEVTIRLNNPAEVEAFHQLTNYGREVGELVESRVEIRKDAIAGILSDCYHVVTPLL